MASFILVLSYQHFDFYNYGILQNFFYQAECGGLNEKLQNYSFEKNPLFSFINAFNFLKL